MTSGGDVIGLEVLPVRCLLIKVFRVLNHHCNQGIELSHNPFAGPLQATFSPPQPLESTDLVFVPMVLPFPRCLSGLCSTQPLVFGFIT